MSDTRLIHERDEAVANDPEALSAQGSQRNQDICLEITGLKVFAEKREIIHGIDLTIHKGEKFALIGESGSGKSLTCLSVMGLLGPGLRAEGSIKLASHNIDLLSAGERTLRDLRGNAMSMVFQEPMTALNPLMTVGRQIAEVVELHKGTQPKDAMESLVNGMLVNVGISDPERVAKMYPFQLSGGQRQRVMLAMAMINKPDILLADEPTTALDVTVQKQITDLMDEQVTANDSALLFITHDLGVVAGLCDTVAIMRKGRIIERGKLAEVFSHPQQTYTKALLAAATLAGDPRTHRLYTLLDMERTWGDTGDIDRNQDESDAIDDATQYGMAEDVVASSEKSAQMFASERGDGDSRKIAAQARRTLERFVPPHDCIGALDSESIVFNKYQMPLSENPPEVVLKVTELTRKYRVGGMFSSKTVDALNGISFDVHRGEKFGIVGESGCGKSTTLRILAGLDQATSGSVKIYGKEIEGGSVRADSWVHKTVQIVFQDPMGSLDPRMRIWEIITEPLAHAPRDERRAKAMELLEAVGVGESVADRYPHQFSGGQRQRIAIARALVTHPDILIADEAVSALDVSVRAQVLNLLADLADEYAFTLIFVSHDLHVVRNQCDVVAVMDKGRIVECGSSDEIYDHPQHEYTQKLVASMPCLRY